MANMKLKPILLLSAFMLVLVACGGEDETGLDSMSTPIPTDTPDLNATIEAKVQSLEQDIAALKEQVAQAQAVNKELEGEIVPGSEGSYPKNKSPFLALRFTHIDGEDYGRGFVEEYIGEQDASGCP